MKVKLITSKLEAILAEIKGKKDSYEKSNDEEMPYDEQIVQIREYIENREYGLAYETIICILEKLDADIPAKISVVLIELALLFRFKTERSEDGIFDIR